MKLPGLVLGRHATRYIHTYLLCRYYISPVLCDINTQQLLSVSTYYLDIPTNTRLNISKSYTPHIGALEYKIGPSFYRIYLVPT